MERILIADDSETARMFVRKCLEIAGCRDAAFVEAADGNEALERMREAPPDLLVTDLNMPEMDGTALLEKVRASPKLCAVPVIVVTSASNPAKDRKLLAMGAKTVLSKPISPASMAQALQEVRGGEDAAIF